MFATDGRGNGLDAAADGRRDRRARSGEAAGVRSDARAAERGLLNPGDRSRVRDRAAPAVTSRLRRRSSKASSSRRIHLDHALGAEGRWHRSIEQFTGTIQRTREGSARRLGQGQSRRDHRRAGRSAVDRRRKSSCRTSRSLGAPGAREGRTAQQQQAAQAVASWRRRPSNSLKQTRRSKSALTDDARRAGEWARMKRDALVGTRRRAAAR
jgi:hypothetical protein